MSSNGYTRIVEVFEQNETAAQFLRDDGEGGFASGVERMAKEIERLRESARTAADRQQQDDCAGGWRKIDENTPDDEPHIRGLWVYRTDRTKPPVWFCSVGRVEADEWYRFVDLSGEDTGWHPEDYTHWMPLPPAPNEEA